MRAYRVVFLFILSAFLLPAHAQTPWIGTPVFSTQLASETDSVNPANLNVHLVFPVFAKPGRGMNLSYVRSMDSLVWMAVKTDPVNNIWSWVPVASNSGFSGDGVFGSVTWSESSNTCGRQGGTWITRSDYVYHDPSGTSHSFPGVSVPVQSCNGYQFPGMTTTSPDGSGYRLSLAAAPNIWASIIARDGTTAGQSQTSGMQFFWTTDYNGNQINYVSTPLAAATDTLGTSSVHFSAVSANPQLVTYPQPGNPTNYVGAAFAYSNYTVKTNFGCQGRNEYGPTTTPLINTITLADGSYYAFTYEPTPGYPGDTTGRIASVRFPSGATISYTYTGANGGINCTDGSLMGLQRVTPDGTWTYTRSGGSTTLVDPKGNQTIFDFASLANTNGWSDTVIYTGSSMEARRRIYQGSTTLLRTIETCYNGAAFPCTASLITLPITRTTVRTELPDASGLVSQVDTFYDTGPYGLVTEVDEYDFGTGGPPATPVRKTLTTYASFPSNTNIQDRPLTVTVQDGSGAVKSQTTYAYDETAVTPTTGTPQHVSVTGSRGNPTTITRLVQGSTTVRRTKSYFDTGTLKTETDFAGNVTTYAYGAASCGNSFPTQVTLPLNLTKSAAWDCNGGVLTSATEENNKVTSYIYGDPSFWRLTQVNYPDGGQATATYNMGTTSPWNIVQTNKITSSLTLSQKTVYDSLGRVSQHQITSDAQGTVYSDTTYDSVGRVATVSNPYRSTGDSTYGITTYKYDALGRTCVVVPPDGTAVSGNTCPATQPTNDIFTTYSANTTTVKDQAGKARKSVTDGLRRLTQVFEDPTGSNYETDYQYDTLGNLTRVDQKGNDSNSANWRTRTFTYNSLSQLLTAANPESGTICYGTYSGSVCQGNGYDANGNLVTKTAPAPNQTGSATVTTTFAYDQLNRLTQKSFSDGTTPTVKYGYDAVSPSGCNPPALTITNGIGRRTSMCDAAGAGAWSYDTLGRPLADQRTTNAVTKATSYTYNLDGSLATLTYPSGRTITYTLASSGSNTAGRISSAVDSTGPINYATGALYSPAGGLSSFTNGASIVSTYFYNSRLQPCRISVKNIGTAPTTCTDAATGNVLDFTYNFSVGTANNGNVTAITNNRDSTRSQSFSYDPLNRIATAKTTSTTGSTCWDEAFGYDPWGNLLSIGRISGYTCSNEELLSVSATTNNQISGDTYDAAGNLITIPAIANYTFDAENHLKTAAGVTYTYDGDGKRVQKSSGKLYWYGMGSDPLDETDLAGNTTNASFNEYIFFGGKRIARRDSTNAVNYYFADHLGTARIVANSSGTVLDDSDFYPFGGERVYLNSSPQNYKFTGKERDSESGLDNFGARYDSSSMGRFMSPDPVMVSWRRMVNPQVWNAYSYAGNNPLRYVDPTGEELIQLGQHTDDEIKKRKNEIKQELKNKDLTKEQKNALKKERNTLNLEQEGNHIVGNMLANLDKTDERNGLTLQNFRLTTDTKNDFPGASPAQIKQFLQDEAFAGAGTSIYLRTESGTAYDKSRTNQDWSLFGSSMLRHEQVHVGGFTENMAYAAQLFVFEKFKTYFQSPILYGDLDAILKQRVQENKDK